MHEFPNLLNLIGLILAIVGFALLLPKLYDISFLRRQEYIDNLDRGKDIRKQKIIKKLRNPGIILVIAGLIFQPLSVILHS